MDRKKSMKLLMIKNIMNIRNIIDIYMNTMKHKNIINIRNILEIMKIINMKYIIVNSELVYVVFLFTGITGVTISSGTLYFPVFRVS